MRGVGGVIPNDESDVIGETKNRMVRFLFRKHAPSHTPRSPTLPLPAISFAGCNVESASVDLSVGAERTTVLKAVSEGETRFRSMAMASDTDLGFPSPDGPGRQFLAEFGEFPVYLVNRDMQVRNTHE